MEGNGYLLSLRNTKRYTPYEFDNMMSQNENRMDTLGKIIDQDIYNCMMADRKTPLVLTPKLILENNNTINSLGPKKNYNNFSYQSQKFKKYPLQQISNDSFKIPRSPRNNNQIPVDRYMNEENNIINNNKQLQRNLNDEYTQYHPEEDNKPYWKYDGPTNLNIEKKHYPRMLNKENFYKQRNDEPYKINHTEINNEIYNRDNDYPERYYNGNNNNFKSQDFSRNKNNNYMEIRRPSPYYDGYDKTNNYRYNNRYNNGNFDERNNRNPRLYNSQKNINDCNNINSNKNEESKGKVDYSHRGYYNSQLNFPFDRYEDEY